MFPLGFGAWRFLLAFLVAISHLYAGMIHGPAAYAVWGFFVLSGYLMTLVLTTKYGFSPAGLKDYAFNRFLRIFPSYWLVSAIGVVTILYMRSRGVDLLGLNPEFQLPQDTQGWAFVVTLLPVFNRSGMPVPVSSALAVEVGTYILIPLMAISRPAAWLGLLLSFFLNAHYGFASASFGARYSEFLTGLLPFAAGALVCHYRHALSYLVLPRLSVLAWLAHCLIWLYYDPWPWTYGLYSSTLLSAWVVLSLAGVRGGKLDGWLGDLSYAVYLIHTTAAAWFLPAMGPSRSMPFFLVSFAVTLALSTLLVIFVERPLAFRKKRAKNPVPEQMGTAAVPEASKVPG